MPELTIIELLQAGNVPAVLVMAVLLWRTERRLLRVELSLELLKAEVKRLEGAR